MADAAFASTHHRAQPRMWYGLPRRSESMLCPQPAMEIVAALLSGYLRHQSLYGARSLPSFSSLLSAKHELASGPKNAWVSTPFWPKPDIERFCSIVAQTAAHLLFRCLNSVSIHDLLAPAARYSICADRVLRHISRLELLHSSRPFHLSRGASVQC